MHLGKDSYLCLLKKILFLSIRIQLASYIYFSFYQHEIL